MRLRILNEVENFSNGIENFFNAVENFFQCRIYMGVHLLL